MLEIRPHKRIAFPHPLWHLPLVRRGNFTSVGRVFFPQFNFLPRAAPTETPLPAGFPRHLLPPHSEIKRRALRCRRLETFTPFHPNRYISVVSPTGLAIDRRPAAGRWIPEITVSVFWGIADLAKVQQLSARRANGKNMTTIEMK